ncbi:FAT domain-containing protein [Rhodocollybia butyracea]|uniref:FAT domain-containing protein n=1 Tax=Rhodocollybia butyracea TaxID=206335 RepID=A0A9P5Q7S4_9AGAR|nr:FAT domain-containing protein [Rhodocollybia butyracea]
MAANNSVDVSTHIASTADLEQRAARIADPSIDLSTKNAVACEIRDLLDTTRDTDTIRVLPWLIPTLLDLLRTGEPVFRKDVPEFQFRKVLLEILIRIPVGEQVRPHCASMVECIQHLLRNDNEDNVILACKIYVDLVRNYRCINEENLSNFTTIFQESQLRMEALTSKYLAIDSLVVDPNESFLGMDSPKVVAEMSLDMALFSQAAQASRTIVAPAIKSTIQSSFNLLGLEAPAQKKDREDTEAMGSIWTGMSPTIKNPALYQDFISAQIKMLSYLAFVMRHSPEQSDNYGDRLILHALRLQQDCPANAMSLRKELMVVFRHLMATPYRRSLLPHIDKLLNERLLIGDGLASKEILRPHVFTAIADLFHHLKPELTNIQLTKIVHMYSNLLHNAALGINVHTLFTKSLIGLGDAILTKETPQNAAYLMTLMFNTCLDRLEALTVVHEELAMTAEKTKNGEMLIMNDAFIEKARPVGGAAAYALEKPEEVMMESRPLFRTLLHGFRVCLAALKKCEGPAPDGTLICRMFEGCIRCMAYFELDSRPNEPGDVNDWFPPILLEVNPHVFQEVWTQKIEFFFTHAQKKIVLLNICQLLFQKDTCSPTLLAIVLKFLVDRLPLLGEYDDLTAAATIRWFKMTFAAVAYFPAANEPILASHLGKLLMDCFPLAVKATKPTHYFHLLRALFRSIGGGGGRFELLYKEVLPLLPEMLDCLNRQFLASEGQTRDMIVELCLTVPLRLTHLLPYLSYLMHPLTVALRGGPELVAQGLRTLELCIDNLTPDFLDPTLNIVLRELMEALCSHLKPLPANHALAHTTIRILGKLGGRNRRLLAKEPALEYRHHSEDPMITIAFLGVQQKITMAPGVDLARQNITKGSTPAAVPAYEYMEAALSALLNQGIKGRNAEELFINILEGIFDAIHVAEVQEKAEAFIRKLSHAVFDAELKRSPSREGSTYRSSALLSSYLEAIPYAVARAQVEQAFKVRNLIASIVNDLVVYTKEKNFAMQDLYLILHQITNRFTALCLDDPWPRKIAGCGGIKMMTETPEVGVKWVRDRELDLVRTLLHILKDLPADLPKDVDEIIRVLTEVLRIGSSDIDFHSDTATQPQVRSKLIALVGVFFPELQSAIPVVRQAAQACIKFLVQLSGRPAFDLLLPHRDRMLISIFTKPLRALTFPIQIGLIEAVRYCVSLTPPLLDLNDELLRLLHETLALADAEDAALLSRSNPRQGQLEMTKLRVACIKLLTAAMPMTDFFQKSPQTRQRVTSVYFKSLYSPSSEVKDVAHEGLRMVLSHQSRLPKELLQTGLRPILMNLADPKRLSVPGLEGLARLLELLTNYFKVEIGHKLLDHFRFVADPQMLQASSRSPLGENEGITKLVRLANIFHLLPSAANIFLDSLVNAIVQTEAQMHFSGQSPFSEPLARYLDRYPVEGVQFFLENLHLPRHLRTLRSILQARLAPNVQRILASRTATILSLMSEHPPRIIPVLSLFADLAHLDPCWVSEHDNVIEVLLVMWDTGMRQPERETVQRHTLIMSIFCSALEKSCRIDLIFPLVAIYTRNLEIDLVRTTHFLYQHIALNTDTAFQRNVLLRFLAWFETSAYSWSHKAFFIRYVVTPILLVHAGRNPSKQHLLDLSFVDRLHSLIWRRILEGDPFTDTDDMFNIELLHLTTVLVQHYSSACAWHFIASCDDPITPAKFILRTWSELLRAPQAEGRALLRQEALAVLAPSLPDEPADNGFPKWAVTARRLLADDFSQTLAIYHLMIKQPALYYPVRRLFVTYMVNSLSKLGLMPTSNTETRVLSIDILQVIFNWERQALAEREALDTSDVWLTPLGYRENMVSYLVRLATLVTDSSARASVVPRALPLLQQMVGPNGWTDVAFGLRFFSRALEMNEINSETALTIAVASAKVLQVIAAEQSDEWWISNAAVLQKLIRKGLTTEEYALHDALHPIFDRLVRMYPLPKEEEEPQGEMGEFHAWIYTAIGEALRNTTTLRGVLLMLKSVVQVVPERIEYFSPHLMKLLGKILKEHVSGSTAITNVLDPSVRLIISVVDICEISMAFLGEQRKWLFSNLVIMVDKSKNVALCRFLLDLVKSWCLVKRDLYPTMREKSALLLRMVTYESRSDTLFTSFLEMVYEIYTEPSLRRSDLTTRLEPLFFIGCRSQDFSLRERFLDLLDVSVPRSLFNRLMYICAVQSWESVADHNWLHIALHLLLGSCDPDATLPHERRSSSSSIGRPKTHDMIRPMLSLVSTTPHSVHDTWVSVFPAAWACLSRREQGDLTQHMINLLSKEYHVKQAEMRPNVIQTLLAGLHACSPPMILPPHLIKYLAKTFGAWYIALEIIGSSFDHLKDDELTLRDNTLDSLADVYSELAEDDMFYGLWRRRCLQPETNNAIALEQIGLWDQAMTSYENAQQRARSGAIPYTEQEYCLWEDHWILSAEKLQQWDLLYELGRNEGNHDLILESAWRVKDWLENREGLEEHIAQLPEVPTPRRRVFEAFLALLKPQAAGDKNAEFTVILEDAMQIALRKWVSLPPHLSPAHVPLLQHFQQFVELQEAVQIFGSLASTNAQNLEKKSSELKMVLQAWRERLPNLHDDISIWSDLVAWRQNVFHSINNAYIPLITPSTQTGAANTNTAGYRGYHETAWIINRFAHVARKHELLDVCHTALAKIYTLPNIEISEAFLKLREQARCYYQKPNDLQAGLEVINNTNLVYFSVSQKAEFFTLKGLFHARFGRQEDANGAFGQAVQMDMNQAKAWAEWGRWNDRMFKDFPTDLSYAGNAVSCYLQAAGLYKSGKSRPLLARVLWLLSVDDASFTVSRAFDTYKGEAAFWFWITLIPQLCSSLSHREVKQARYVLLNLARLYPQALFFHLRTTREEVLTAKRMVPRPSASQAQPAARTTSESSASTNGNDVPSTDGTSNAQPSADNSQGTAAQNGQQFIVDPAAVHRPTWDCVEELVQNLKTSFPLLILNLETLVDQIINRFKPTHEEDIYRHICMLLQDALQHYLVRVNQIEDDGQLAVSTVANLHRLALGISHPQVKKEYEEDFITTKLTHYEYIQRLQQWRDKYEVLLDGRPRVQPLDSLSHYLTEFQYSKVDELDVPGQYTEDKDNNQNFIKISKLVPKFENTRSQGCCWKRITIHGNDNSKIPFVVQLPYHRTFRREERVSQVCRTFNGVLSRKKETRKRNLNFHLPTAVSCSPNIRLYQMDSSYISLSDIYELHCESMGIQREDPILYSGEKVKKVMRELKQAGRQFNKSDYITLKKNVIDEVSSKMIPEDVLTQYMMRTMDGPSSLWRMRKQFALQHAANCFMTFIFFMSSRQPARFHVSRSTGLVAMSELFAGLGGQQPVFSTSDVVPFRFTPALQNFLGPIVTEGIFAPSIMAIGRSLTETEYALDTPLRLFVRDEICGWLIQRNRPVTIDQGFRQAVNVSIDAVVNRAEAMACKVDREQAGTNTLPVLQTVTNTISAATNPVQLTKMGELYYPWF